MIFHKFLLFKVFGYSLPLFFAVCLPSCKPPPPDFGSKGRSSGLDYPPLSQGSECWDCLRHGQSHSRDSSNREISQLGVLLFLPQGTLIHFYKTKIILTLTSFGFNDSVFFYRTWLATVQTMWGNISCYKNERWLEIVGLMYDNY